VPSFRFLVVVVRRIGVTLSVADLDSASAITRSRSAEACWYRMAAPGVECPNRAINSASVAPVAAAKVAPVPHVVEPQIRPPGGFAGRKNTGVR
jgi:hypothetical protein